ncbi:hypothetical protein [Campylobacter cuniculorum]|uniref:Uncharacterized protein n=2 Tax=Campylobacter cuniculorum TaxID=374106 RepID=A0A1W6BXX5_9BACT|nr:hypothetical protein [Campylobacter cuniculorum]ARJ56890.1 hypothetical protein CCUN_1301 [Campylobacter cuniculorum DSM 23162 = LMG 24588]QOR04352.1 hypothetical protein A0071_09420 [Campylobacter cuniculorum]
MYEKKDLRVLKILQKAREFGDEDLLNEDLLTQLINTQLCKLSLEEREEVVLILNSLIATKDKALLSNK